MTRLNLLYLKLENVGYPVEIIYETHRNNKKQIESNVFGEKIHAMKFLSYFNSSGEIIPKEVIRVRNDGTKYPSIDGYYMRISKIVSTIENIKNKGGTIYSKEKEKEEERN